MSPNAGFQEGIFDNVQVICPICETQARDIAVCAGCGTYGHPECLRLEMFVEYPFCQACIPRVAAEYATFQDAQRREAWRRSLESQVSVWKSRVIEAIGLSSTIGVAVGGAVVAVAGAAAGLAQGAVRGAAAAAASSTPQLALPPTSEVPASHVPADPLGGRDGNPSDSSAEGATSAAQRQRSLESRPSPSCLMCWNPGLGCVRPIQHTYQGDCRLASTTEPTTAVLQTAPSTSTATGLAAAAAAVPEVLTAPAVAPASPTVSAALEAALATRVPSTPSSMFGSAASAVGDLMQTAGAAKSRIPLDRLPPLPQTPAAQTQSAGAAGSSSGGKPFDKLPRREGILPTAPDSQQQPAAVTPEERAPSLERMMLEMK